MPDTLANNDASLKDRINVEQYLNFKMMSYISMTYRNVTIIGMETNERIGFFNETQL